MIIRANNTYLEFNSRVTVTIVEEYETTRLCARDLWDLSDCKLVLTSLAQYLQYWLSKVHKRSKESLESKREELAKLKTDTSAWADVRRQELQRDIDSLNRKIASLEKTLASLALLVEGI